MFHISQEEIEDDIASKNKCSGLNKDDPPDILGMIQQVALCRKISLIDDLILSRNLRESGDENSEFICLRTNTIKELEKISTLTDSSFLSFEVSSLSENDHLRSFLSNIIKEVETSVDVQSYIKNVLNVIPQQQIKKFGAKHESVEPSIEIPISVVAELTQLHSTASQQDISQHQAVRDIERDVICVNGKTLKGAEFGYDGVVQFLVSIMVSIFPKRIKRETSLTELTKSNVLYQDMFHFQALFDIDNKSNASSGTDHGSDDLILSNFASLLLRAVNRTESGHWSFAMVSALCNNPLFSVVVPDSSAATPLNITLSLGPLSVSRKSMTSHDQHAPPVIGWGLRAAVETSTVYDIYDTECENVMLRMKARFAHHLALPLGRHFSPGSVQGKVEWERLSKGSVSISVHRVA